MSKKHVQAAIAAPAEARYLTIKGAAAYASLTVWFVRELIWGRKIPYARLGNRYVIDRENLDKFIAAETVCAR
ncbi:MAG: excisionase family DNA-binding protein [Candidatus Acidiferrales bacterium]